MKPEQLFNAPVPGQSLTRSPEAKGPWEMPPKLTTPEEAMDHMLGVIMSKKFAQNLATLLRKDKKAHIDKIASQMVQEGFIGGLWTVDIAMLIIEPVLCMLVFAAAQLDASVSFSTDSGYEDRTGFDYLTDAVMDADPEVNANMGIPAEEISETKGAVEESQPTPEVPAQPPAPISPLIGGQ